MESLDALLIRMGATNVAVTLLIIAVTFVVLCFLARRNLNQLASQLADKEDEFQRKRRDRDQVLLNTQMQLYKLKEHIQNLSEHTYIKHFDPDHVYTLAARAEAEFDGKRSFFGLVRLDNRVLVPFFTQDALEELQIGDQFSLVGGRITGIKPPRISVRREPEPLPLQPSLAPQDEKTEARFAADESEATIMLPAGDRSVDIEEYYRGLPCLKVVEGKDKGSLFCLPFIQGKIGRDPANNVSLDDDRSSRIHAFIDYDDHTFVLRDNHSTNGTYLNGSHVDTAVLNFGDTIAIGNTRMVFTAEGYELREKSPAEAIALFEKCLSVEPDFIMGLKYLAFLLERDVRRKGESDAIYTRLKRLEKGA